MEQYYTYALIDPRNNAMFYVGKGKGRRCDSHVYEARHTNKNSYKLQKIRKIESLGFSVIVKKIDEHISDVQAQELEKFVIAEARTLGIRLTNMTDGGDVSSGYKHRAESLLKISSAMKGQPKPDYMKVSLSEYHRLNPEKNPSKQLDYAAKVSGSKHWNYGKPAVNRGVPMTAEQRKHLSEVTSGDKHWHYGKKHSPETIAKMTGLTRSEETKQKMRKPKIKTPCKSCGKMCAPNILNRYHNDNCKDANNVAGS